MLKKFLALHVKLLVIPLQVKWAEKNPCLQCKPVIKHCNKSVSAQEPQTKRLIIHIEEKTMVLPPKKKKKSFLFPQLLSLYYEWLLQTLLSRLYYYLWVIIWIKKENKKSRGGLISGGGRSRMWPFCVKDSGFVYSYQCTQPISSPEWTQSAAVTAANRHPEPTTDVLKDLPSPSWA